MSLEKKGLASLPEGKGSTKAIQMPLALQVTLLSSLAALLHRGIQQQDQPVSAQVSQRDEAEKNTQRKHSQLSSLSDLKEPENAAPHRFTCHRITHSILELSRNRLRGRAADWASTVTAVPVV